MFNISLAKNMGIIEWELLNVTVYVNKWENKGIV